MFEIKITLENDAFKNNPEDETRRIISRGLEYLFSKPTEAGSSRQVNLRDIDGNTVGYVYYEPPVE